MTVVLYHRIGDPDSAVARRRVVELGYARCGSLTGAPAPEPRVDFQNVDTDGAEAWANARGKALPALWDGARLHEGQRAVLAALETLRR
jgi:hypothetical protein